MRYIITLEDDLSLSRHWIGESPQYIGHVSPREALVLQSCEFSLVGIFTELVLCEVEEIFFGSDSRSFELDAL